MKNPPEHNFQSGVGKSVTAVAYANIALIKYWGKRSIELNLPATGSLSITLDALQTETTIRFDNSFSADQLFLDGTQAKLSQQERTSRFLDLVAGTPDRPRAHITSHNSFPTGAGLASSASGFAALAKAAAYALGQGFSPKELSMLARQGSGSAARSVFGGFVEMNCGKGENGQRDYAIPLYNQDYWDLRVLVAITESRHKGIGSTEGMKLTKQTSPFYESWVSSSVGDLTNMKRALSERDFTRVGELAEHSSFKMHGLMLSSVPPLLYWNPVTVEVIKKIRKMRTQGTEAYVTIDAGPQVKILCRPETVASVKKELNTISGIQQLIEAGLGPGVKIKNVK